MTHNYTYTDLHTNIRTDAILFYQKITFGMRRINYTYWHTNTYDDIRRQKETCTQNSTQKHRQTNALYQKYIIIV